MKASLFDQLIEAIRCYQTGVTHLRSILAPLHEDATADDEKAAFHNQAQGDPLGVSMIQKCLEDSGLELPPDLVEALASLDYVVDPVGAGVVTPVATDGIHATPEAALAASAAFSQAVSQGETPAAADKAAADAAAAEQAAADAAAIGH